MPPRSVGAVRGASPFRVLRSIIIPQAKPGARGGRALPFLRAWNDYFLPLVYLHGKRELAPTAVGIADFNALYPQEPTLIQASALMALAVPLIVFFLAQRAFMRGVVVTGVDK